jgi:AraC family transcriptional regulator
MESELGVAKILSAGTYIGRTRSHLDIPGLTLAVMTATGAPGEVAEHGHEEAHLLLLMSPNYCSAADDAPEITCDAAAIFNPEGTFHSDRFRAPGTFLSLTMERQWITALRDELTLPTAPTLTDQAGLLQRARELVGLCMYNDIDDQCAVESLCLEFAAGFTRRRSESARPSWLRQARELLHDEADVSRWSIRRVAQELSVTPAHLARVFRVHVGCTPGDYVHAIRLQRAAQLLSSTNISIAEMASQLGYADQSHFTRRFQRALRTTPAAYRAAVS